MKKCIITVVGKNKVGIIAGVTKYLAENNVDILEITQTIVKGYFNMMMIVDVNGSSKKIPEIANEMELLGENLGVVIKCQNEEIFEMMHRL